MVEAVEAAEEDEDGEDGQVLDRVQVGAHGALVAIGAVRDVGAERVRARLLEEDGAEARQADAEEDEEQGPGREAEQRPMRENHARKLADFTAGRGTAISARMQQIQGPRGTIRYRRDELGYPTLEAGDFADGTYGLGYLHAQDRLVQVTLLGMAARGRLMSVVGDKPLPRLIDHSVRAMGLGADLSEQVAACDEAGRGSLENYCAGFNAGAKGRRPLVLRLLGVSAPVFTPEDVVAIFRFVTYFGLNSIQLSVELLIAELLARGAPERLLQRLLGTRSRARTGRR